MKCEISIFKKIDEMQVSLRNMLGKQFLITAYIEQKLQLVNYIKTGYDENKPILINNRFLHFTAHIYYRSIVVDLYALFGKANNSNKYSLLHLPLKFVGEVTDSTIEKANNWLEANKSNFEIIQKLRHQQIAHYDFSVNESISLNFDNLFILNDLYDLAVKIISLFGSSTKKEKDSMGFDFGRMHDKVDSLERLIRKAGH